MAEDTEDDQKTEEPTDKRLGEARSRGQLPVSREMSTFIVLLSIFIVIKNLGPAFSNDLMSSLRFFIEQPNEISLDGQGLQAALMNVGVGISLSAIALFGVLALAAFLGTAAQTGFFMSFEMIKFDLTRLNPMSGFGRLFSSNSLLELAKSFLKIVILGLISYAMLKPVVASLPMMAGLGLVDAMSRTHREAVHILQVLLIAVAVMAIADWIYQKRQYIKQLRMTKTEVKDEYKQTEGDPKVKARLRQVRMEKARKRMMARVPKADVVITNPTHYAVALEYDSKKMKAPVVVAKGADKIAERIRTIATENNVPLVSNPPLARALYSSVEVDYPIKTEHYRAVAEVISYVYKLKKKRV